MDQILASAEKLSPLMALALFDDASKGSGVLGRLNKGIGAWAADTYKRAQEATHQAVAASALEDLVRGTERLARGIEQMK